MIDFVSLHNHSDFSILDSLAPVKELFARAKELGQSAIAITDHGSLAAAWTAFKLAQSMKIKLIMGCEMYFQDNDYNHDEKLRHIILLAKNAEGYSNLLTLNKKGFDQNVILGNKAYSVINWKLLEEHSAGLICLTACGNGILNQLLIANKMEDVKKTIVRLKSIFGDNLGLEIHPNNLKRNQNIYHEAIDQQFFNAKLIALGKEYGIRVVPTCNTHYVNKEESETHDVLLSIGSHQPVSSNFRLKYSVPEFYLKSGDEVKAFFARNNGEEYAQQLCDNSLYFAGLCEDPAWIDPKYTNPSGKELPEFPVKDQDDYDEFLQWENKQEETVKALDEDKKYLRYVCVKNFHKIKDLDENKTVLYKDRIDEELDILEFHGFSSYMLVAADYLDWARANGVAVGMGRGSVGGSLVAYLQNIHQADPIEYGLIFARFHNKEKSSYPDIDSDFAPSGREKVQNYLRKKYGEDNVACVSNINTITPKVYARDIARACELGGSKEEAIIIGNSVADSISAEFHSIDEAMQKSAIFSAYCEKYPEYVKYKAICGKCRAWSTHAAGIIISKRALTGLVPLRKDKDGILALEYDKNKAEETGLVKFDTLGLATLDIISDTVNLIKESGGEDPLIDLKYDDKKTYDLITEGDTFGVFQFGTSAGTVDLCKKVKPSNIEDLANINALARPSAKDMREDFILTKNGKQPMVLLHPSLERAFKGTYGFGLYEECLMYLAQDVAGWSLHEADRLRKLTKEKGKNPEKVNKWRQEFIEGAVVNKVPEYIAIRIWDEVVIGFEGYGFNRSHASLYSMISYQTAYLKAHYPIQFLLANLLAEVNSNAADSAKKIQQIKKEIRAHKVKILRPDINKSSLSYKLQGKELITGLDALKFVGDDAIKDIIQKRPFSSFLDFMVRVDSKKVRSNTIQALASCGCLDSFNIPRKLIYLYCSDYRKKLQVWLKKHDPNKEQFAFPWPQEDDWSKSEIYALEQFYLGESFSCKPADAYGNFFKDEHPTIMTIKKSKEKTNLAGIKAVVKDVFEFKVKKETSKYLGQSMIKAVIEDKNGEQCSCTIFPDRLENMKDMMKVFYSKAKFEPGIAICFSGNVNSYDGEVGIILDKLFNFSLNPSKPDDLKAKKISLKKEAKPLKPSSNELLFEDIEDEMINDGLLDAEEDSD